MVSFNGLEVSVDPWDGVDNDANDRDLRYWIATAAAAPDLSGYSLNTLSSGFGASTLSSAPSSYNLYTHVLHSPSTAPLVGNLLLIAGDFVNRNCTATNISGDVECEAWKLTSVVVDPLSQVVPVPAAAWLLGSALGLLGMVRRRAA